MSASPLLRASAAVRDAERARMFHQGSVRRAFWRDGWARQAPSPWLLPWARSLVSPDARQKDAAHAEPFCRIQTASAVASHSSQAEQPQNGGLGEISRLPRPHRDFETRKRVFGPMAALHILAMRRGIAVVCAWPSGRIHHFLRVPKPLCQRTIELYESHDIRSP
jgi:hypothetical protein